MIPADAIKMNQFYDEVVNQKKKIERVRFICTNNGRVFRFGGLGQDVAQLTAMAMRLMSEQKVVDYAVLQYHTGSATTISYI